MPSPDQERWQRVDAILQGVFGVPEPEQEAYLQRACNGERELLREVEILLEADREATQGLLGSLDALGLDAPGIDPCPASREQGPGTLFGPYRVLEPLARGGMSEVFLAERADGSFDRRVVIKILPPHLGGASWVARFLREQQILGQLEHPAIARILDASVNHPTRAYPWTFLGSLLDRTGRSAEAEILLREALEMRRTAFPEDHPMVAEVRLRLGTCLRRAGRLDEAEPLLVRAERELAPSSRRKDHRQAVAELVELHRTRGDAVALEHWEQKSEELERGE
jgi:tetratricopeptide (TPR) repeat protein